ncbi:MAG TPA: hypothetical protein VFV87_15915, partial [Pirellulaceae bacterium]|nr:hypothetical protein [Pirellulaceae bacterium]
RAAHNEGMPPEDSAQTERAEREQRAEPEGRDSLDEPVDATVYDVHPALVQQPAYPYGRPTARDTAPVDLTDPRGENPFRMREPESHRRQAVFSFPVAQPARYKVPERFGMSAILGIMTALALLFGGLRLLDAYPAIYLFFGLQAVVICIVQMFYGKTPRAASAIAGAIILPAFILLGAMSERRGPPLSGVLCLMTMGVPIGAFLGYLTGTCAAGIFLVMDALEPYLQGRRPVSLGTQPTAAPPVAS